MVIPPKVQGKRWLENTQPQAQRPLAVPLLCLNQCTRPANTAGSPTAVASPDGMDKQTEPSVTPVVEDTAMPIETKRKKKMKTGDTPNAAGNGGLPYANPLMSVQVEEVGNKALNMKAIDDQATTKTGDSGKEKAKRPDVENNNNKGDDNAAPTTTPKDQAGILGKHPSMVKPKAAKTTNPDAGQFAI
ncbi:hypothetical protein DM860_004568 [Cuscuta australis]|uniref:Uncharacterized protein n=1 Tax=Cuscuta australis TaxID=267555 RepID=A0A328E880_9ASTE|nr:hypothetical protein DM860_004568 [Cuscuta australis]